MFPLPWNFPFRKKDGSIVNVVDAMGGGGGGGSDLPDYDSSDAGKVLGVDANGDLEWSDEVNTEIEDLTNNVESLDSRVDKLGAKNFLRNDAVSKEESGITFTVRDDGTILVSGTSTDEVLLTIRDDLYLPDGVYTMSLEPIIPNQYAEIDVSIKSADDSEVLEYFKLGNPELFPVWENEHTFTYSSATAGRIIIVLKIWNTTFMQDAVIKPMIRLASDPDTTYQPYAKTNQELTAENQTLTNNVDVLIENGAVNGCPNDATTQTTGGGGVTLTVNADKSITFSGTATTASNIELGNISDFYKGKALKMYSGAKTTDAYIYLQYTQDGSTKYITDDSFTIPTDATSVKAFIHVNSTGVFTTPVTVYPMFTLPDYNGPYVPYAKTNRDLTEETTIVIKGVTSLGATATFTKYGKVVLVNFAGSGLTESVSANTTIFTVPDGFKAATVFSYLTTNKVASLSDYARLAIDPNNGIYCASSLAAGDTLRGTMVYICE